MNKGQISIQTLFYILMLILMVSIIVFGIQKLFFVSDTLSEVEFVEIKNEIRNAVEACSDPLKKGNQKTLTYSVPDFNTLCIIGSEDYRGNPEISETLSKVRQAGGSIALLEVKTVDIDATGDETMFDLIEHNLIDVIETEDLGQIETFCRFQFNEPKLTIPIKCE